MSGTIGDNVFRASGVVVASAAGISWCSSVKTSAFCAEAGNGYFINTCGGTFEVTLPGSADVGDEINFTDFARTWGTACKELTIDQNSLKYQGYTSPKPEYDTEGATVKIVYSGATQGWIPQLDKGTSLETPQTYNVQYLVIAGGGSGGAGCGAGGGAGGYRTVATKSLTVCKGTSYAVTVGDGGAAIPNGGPYASGNVGNNSVFSTITSASGGYGAGGPNAGPGVAGGAGGSGGGGHPKGSGGAGNTPPVSPVQGYAGGNGTQGTGNSGGGGGAASEVGENSPGNAGGEGGAGVVSCISASPVQRAGGGGGAWSNGSSGCNCGAGGGGRGGYPGGAAQCATANTGGGGGAGGCGSPGSGTAPNGCGATTGAGGSGVVYIRRLTACSTSSSGTTSTSGDDTIHLFTSTGTFVA